VIEGGAGPATLCKGLTRSSAPAEKMVKPMAFPSSPTAMIHGRIAMLLR
jgi:hypothetical protein